MSDPNLSKNLMLLITPRQQKSIFPPKFVFHLLMFSHLMTCVKIMRSVLYMYEKASHSYETLSQKYENVPHNCEILSENYELLFHYYKTLIAINGVVDMNHNNNIQSFDREQISQF